jgi:predicted RNA-binding Zn-ribbon protein involved in translation (DUF1610 family)
MSTYIVSFYYYAEPKRYDECGVEANNPKEALRRLLTEEGMEYAEADERLNDWTPAETEVGDWFGVAVEPAWKTTCPTCGDEKYSRQPPVLNAAQDHKCECGKDAKYFLSGECNRGLFSLAEPDTKVGYIPAVHKEPTVYYCEDCVSIVNRKAVFWNISDPHDGGNP